MTCVRCKVKKTLLKGDTLCVDCADRQLEAMGLDRLECKFPGVSIGAFIDRQTHAPSISIMSNYDCPECFHKNEQEHALTIDDVRKLHKTLSQFLNSINEAVRKAA